MNLNKTKFVTLIISGMIIISLRTISSIAQYENQPTKDVFIYSNLTPHNDIYIDSDDDFVTLGFTGYGNGTHPYIIENYNITSPNATAIHILGTTKHFIIRNCYIDAISVGIWIQNVVDGTASVINNTCKNNGNYGIYVYSSPYSSLNNNTCIENYYGIYIGFGSESCIATNNTLVNNRIRGFYVTGSAYNTTLSENIISGSEFGIYLESAQNSKLINNICINNIYSGITFTDAENSIFDNNTCSENGEFGIVRSGFLVYRNVTLVDNTCSNNGHSGIYIQNYLECELTSNTCNNNNISSPLGFGIYLISCANSSVSLNKCNKNKIGIYVQSSYTNLENNICLNNNLDGIVLAYNSDSYLFNNTCFSNGDDGITLDNFHQAVLVNNHLLENNQYGVDLLSSNNNYVYNNTFVKNNLGGASQSYDNGNNNYWYNSSLLLGNIWSDWSSGSYLIDGPAGSEDIYPSRIDADSPVITSPGTKNYIEGATNQLIDWYVEDENPNELWVYLDSILNRTGSWTNGTLNHDISGLSVGTYNFTLVVSDIAENIATDTVWVTVEADISPPVITYSSGDVTMSLGSEVHSINWTATDTNPDQYFIYCNGSLERTGTWFSDSLIVLWLHQLNFGLDVGTYNLTIVFNDLYNNSASDTVWVTVESSIISEYTQMLTKFLLLPTIALSYVIRKKSRRFKNS